MDDSAVGEDIKGLPDGERVRADCFGETNQSHPSLPCQGETPEQQNSSGTNGRPKRRLDRLAENIADRDLSDVALEAVAGQGDRQSRKTFRLVHDLADQSVRSCDAGRSHDPYDLVACQSVQLVYLFVLTLE